MKKTIAFFFCIVVCMCAWAKQPAQVSETSLTNMQLGDEYFQQYLFEEAILHYEKALSINDATLTSAQISTIERTIKTAERAHNMLQSVEVIQIIDSLIVGKKDFFSHYKLNEDAGQIVAAEVPDSIVPFIPPTSFITPRKDIELITQLTEENAEEIIMTTKLLDGEIDTIPLSANINTPANESFPFFMPDGITLYFASDGENSIGGYDIFVSSFHLEQNDFLKPENIGMPFNSLANDFLFAIDEEKGVGYFATDRNQPQDTVIIYKFKPNEKRVFVETEDENERIAFAKLAQYQFLEGYDTENDTESKSKKMKNEIFFVVTDAIIYTTLAQFENPKALEAYQTACRIEEENAARQRLLEQKRMEYSVSDKEKQKVLSTEILQLEKEVISPTTKSPDYYFKLARKLEIEKK